MGGQKPGYVKSINLRYVKTYVDFITTSITVPNSVPTWRKSGRYSVRLHMLCERAHQELQRNMHTKPIRERLSGKPGRDHRLVAPSDDRIQTQTALKATRFPDAHMSDNNMHCHRAVTGCHLNLSQTDKDLCNYLFIHSNFMFRYNSMLHPTLEIDGKRVVQIRTRSIIWLALARQLGRNLCSKRWKYGSQPRQRSMNAAASSRD